MTSSDVLPRDKNYKDNDIIAFKKLIMRDITLVSPKSNKHYSSFSLSHLRVLFRSWEEFKPWWYVSIFFDPKFFFFKEFFFNLFMGKALEIV